MLNFDLWYKKFGHIKTFSNYLNWFWKDVFIMTRQLGLPSYLQCVNSWPIVVKTIKNLHIEHAQNFNTKNQCLPNIKDLVKNDLVIYVRDYEHKMNSFWKLIKNNIFYNIIPIHKFSPWLWNVMV